MLLDKQAKFLSQRLDKFNVIGETKSRLLNSLFQPSNSDHRM